jgi:hypothetical protein
MHEMPDCVVREEYSPYFLADHLGCFGSQDPAVAKLANLDLLEGQFELSGKAGGLPRRPPLSTARAAFTASQRKQAAGAAWDCRVGGRVGE